MKRMILLAVALVVSGCAIESLEVMKEQNARGCVYVRASAQPWAQATTIIVGTWGTDPPKYIDCWRGLPIGLP